MPETCLQVLSVIIHARLRGHCFVGVYNTSRVGVLLNQMVNISKASCQACACLFFFWFWCKSNKSHASAHKPFLTYLSLDGIIGLTISLLCDDVLKKLCKAAGIRETAYRETGSSIRD